MSQPVAPRPFDPRQPPTPTRPADTSTRGPAIMTTVGVVLVVLALVLVVVGIVRLTDTVSEDALDVHDGRWAAVEAREDIPDPVELAAEEDTTYAVLFIGRTGDEVEVRDLAVVGPRGEDVDLDATQVGYTFSTSRTTTHVATFDTDEEGTYTLTVEGPSASASGDLAILDDDLVVGLVVGAVSGLVLLGAGILTGLVGLGLGIGGAVWWSMRRSAARGVTR
ncbi:hypothetical protein [Sanguibacter sp. 25GB23B1]|uniref:hypothetical protein n=1 Tax=unclassified Sanguibacter TaxID=2645534 RepID=UPI0032AFB51B